MDLVDQMRTFVRVVDTGSLSAAARGRGLSLAAISRQLAALEDDLDTSLVVRTTRRLQITPSGRRWYEHCVHMLHQLEDARADVADRGDVRGTVVISAPITLGREYVVARLDQLVRAHPRLDFELRLEDHVIDLVGDNVDIAVRGGIAPPDSPSVIAHPIATFRRIPVASPAYLARRGTPRHPSDLAAHDGVIQHGVGAVFTRWRFTRADEVIEVAPRARLRTTTPLVLRDWAIAGAGVALLPEWLVPRGTRTLRRLLPDWTTNPIHAWALHRVELRTAPRIRATITALATPR